MRQLVEQTAFLLKPRIGLGLDEVGVPDRSAQHHDPALGRRLVAAPNIVAELSDAGRRRAFFGGHHPCLAEVGPRGLGARRCTNRPGKPSRCPQCAGQKSQAPKRHAAPMRTARASGSPCSHPSPRLTYLCLPALSHQLYTEGRPQNMRVKGRSSRPRF